MTERFHLDSDFTGKGFLLFIKYFPSHRPFFISGVINARPILAPAVISLTVHTCRIHHPEVVKQQIPVGNFGSIIRNMNRFRVICLPYIFVIRLVRFPVGITGNHVHYAFHTGKIFLQSPETASRQVHIP